MTVVRAGAGAPQDGDEPGHDGDVDDGAAEASKRSCMIAAIRSMSMAIAVSHPRATTSFVPGACCASAASSATSPMVPITILPSLLFANR